MSTLRTFAAVTGAAALALSLAACGSGSDDSAPAAAGSPAAGGSVSVCPSGTLTMGVEPYEDAKKLIPAYQALAKGLGARLGCKIDVQISDSYTAEILAMQNGKLDLGEFGPAGFVFANQQAGATALASFADKDGKVSTYTAGIWVPKDSPIKTLKDLKGHTLALTGPGSTSGDWLPRKALMDAGVAEKDVKINYGDDHSQSLLALVNGQTDAAEVNSQEQATAMAAHQFDPSQYREIWKSAPILNDPIAAGPNMTPDVAKKVQQALLSLPSDTVKALGGFLEFTPPKSGAMVAVTDKDYQPLFDLAKALHLSSKDL